MSSWRLARVVGAVAMISICFSAFAPGIGAGIAKAPLKSVVEGTKALELLDDSNLMQSNAKASVYAEPEGPSLDRSGFDKLKREELVEDKAAGRHIPPTAGENATTSKIRKWLV